MAGYAVSPLVEANGDKCEKCGNDATHVIIITENKEKKKMPCCTKQVCIFSLIRGEE